MCWIHRLLSLSARPPPIYFPTLQNPKPKWRRRRCRKKRLHRREMLRTKFNFETFRRRKFDSNLLKSHSLHRASRTSNIIRCQMTIFHVIDWLTGRKKNANKMRFDSMLCVMKRNGISFDCRRRHGRRFETFLSFVFIIYSIELWQTIELHSNIDASHLITSLQHRYGCLANTNEHIELRISRRLNRHV